MFNLQLTRDAQRRFALAWNNVPLFAMDNVSHALNALEQCDVYLNGHCPAFDRQDRDEIESAKKLLQGGDSADAYDAAMAIAQRAVLYHWHPNECRIDPYPLMVGLA